MKRTLTFNNGSSEDPFELFLGFQNLSEWLTSEPNYYMDHWGTKAGSPFVVDSPEFGQAQTQHNLEKGNVDILMENQSQTENERRQEALEKDHNLQDISVAMENEAPSLQEENQLRNKSLPSRKKVFKAQARIIKIIKVIANEEVHGDVNSLLKKFQTQLTAKIVPASDSASKKESLEQILKSKRGNQTRSTRALLKSMALALLETRQYAPDHMMSSLPQRIEKCNKIKDLSELIAHPQHSEFRLLLQSFVDPGDKFIRLLERSSYHPVIKMLLLETLPGLRMMVSSSLSEVVNSWDLRKLQTKGSYSEALKMVEKSGQAQLPDIMRVVEKEYQRVKKHFSKRACSFSNNTTHFLVKLTKTMLQRIRGQLDQSGPDLEKVMGIEYALWLLQNTESEASIQEATKEQWLKEAIYKEFIETGLLLKEILSMDSTNALTVYNIVGRYKRFVEQVTGRSPGNTS